MLRRLLASMIVLVGVAVLPARAHAQFIPEAGPGQEQQEFATTLLLGPSGTVLGAIVGGAGVFTIERNFFTAKGHDPQVTPVAIGAGVGAAVGATWAQWSVSNHYHPGSRFYSAVGASIGAAAGSALYFGGPANESSNDRVLRVVAFLLGPSLCAYGGWHIGSEGDFYDASAAPAPVWADHLWSDVPRATPVLQTVSLRF